MTEQEILAGLGEIIEEIAGVPADEVTPGKSFVDDLDIDSLSMVEIAVAAQDKFGVEIPDDQLKDLTTVQDVVNYVTKNAGSPVTTTAPAPSAKMMQVDLSSQSTQSLIFSAPMTRALRELPPRTRSAAVPSA